MHVLKRVSTFKCNTTETPLHRGRGNFFDYRRLGLLSSSRQPNVAANVIPLPYLLDVMPVYGLSTDVGRRSSQQDDSIVVEDFWNNEQACVYAVFDGHGGFCRFWIPGPDRMFRRTLSKTAMVNISLTLPCVESK